MNPWLELNLAMILFLPWYAILGALFWIYPRQPRHAARHAFDVASLALATAAAVLGTWWGFRNADATWGAMWKQVLATSLSYGLFLLVLTIAIIVRQRWIARAAREAHAARINGSAR